MKNDSIVIDISLEFVAKRPVNKTLAGVQIMGWHRKGDKPLSEPVIA